MNDGQIWGRRLRPWVDSGSIAGERAAPTAWQPGLTVPRPPVVRFVRDAPRVQFYAGHTEGSRIVHLTVRSFLVEALCGAPVEMDGEPDIAVICEECDRLGREAGGDPAEWLAGVTVRVELRVAA